MKQIDEIEKNLLKIAPCDSCSRKKICSLVCDKYVAFGNISDILLEIKESNNERPDA